MMLKEFFWSFGSNFGGIDDMIPGIWTAMLRPFFETPHFMNGIQKMYSVIERAMERKGKEGNSLFLAYDTFSG